MLMTASANGRALWYLTRSTGFVSLVILTAVVVLGIMSTAGWSSRTWPRFVTQGLHRNLTVLSLAVIVVHIVTTVADGFAPIGFLDAVVPFHSPYRPIWLGFGALSFDLLLAVTITSAVRRHIGYRTWKFVHWASYAMWPMAVVHGLGTGSDTRLSPVLFVNALCVLAVLGAVAWRLTLGSVQAVHRLVLGAVAAVCTLAISLFAIAGPLRPKWAERSGTPMALLAKIAGLNAAAQAASGSSGAPSGQATASSGPSQSSTPTAASSLPSTPFEASYQAMLTQSGPDASGDATVDISGQLSGGASGPLRIVLTGPPDPGGGLSVVSSRVTFLSASGEVVRLDGTRLLAQVSDANGTTLSLDISLRIDQATGAVTGVVRSFLPGQGGDD